jgi:hypothetical protein
VGRAGKRSGMFGPARNPTRRRPNHLMPAFDTSHHGPTAGRGTVSGTVSTARV